MDTTPKWSKRRIYRKADGTCWEVLANGDEKLFESTQEIHKIKSVFEALGEIQGHVQEKIRDSTIDNHYEYLMRLCDVVSLLDERIKALEDAADDQDTENWAHSEYQG